MCGVFRYSSSWIDDYKEKLHRFFDGLSRVLPEETLVIWNLTMPLGERMKGGFLVPEVYNPQPTTSCLDTHSSGHKVSPTLLLGMCVSNCERSVVFNSGYGQTRLMSKLSNSRNLRQFQKEVYM